MHKIERAYQNFIQTRKIAQIHRTLTPLTPLNARTCRIAGREYVNFSSNDYLGLSRHPVLLDRARSWTEKYGTGTGASRLVTGNLDVFTQIEDKIAALKQKSAALVMVSGVQANTSLLPALFDKNVLNAAPLVFADRLNHASMHLGCAAAGVRQIRYAHCDMDHLETLLQKHAASAAPKFILTESVFSMDGDIAPLDDIAALAQKHGAFTIVDEAHATGVLGENGRGLADKADLVVGTFGKAMGSFGAYVACSEYIKDYLVNTCIGLVYATALPPAVLGAIDAALDIVPSMNKDRTHLHTTSQEFRAAMRALGFVTGASETQIVPLITGSASAALSLSAHLKDAGIWATPIRPPTVPGGSARVRITFSAAHTKSDLNTLIAAVTQYAAKDAA